MDRLPIDFRLWAITSGGVVALLVAADVMGVTGGEESLRPNLWMWRSGAISSWALMERAAPRMLLYAAIAMVVGWALHGLLLIGGVRFGSEPSWQNNHDFQEPLDAEIGPDEPWDEHLIRLVALRQKGELLRRGRSGGDAGSAIPIDETEIGRTDPQVSD